MAIASDGKSKVQATKEGASDARLLKMEFEKFDEITFSS